jgi:fucose permease
LGLPDSLLGAAWPSMYGSLNVPPHYAGYIFMIAAAGTVISSLLSARIIRRFSTGPVTAVSVLMTAVSLLGISFSSEYFLLCLWAVPLGLGGGSVDAALNNYVALHYKARHMSWLHCFWGVGASTGPVIMSFYLINKNSWNAGYGAIGLIQSGLVVILFATLFLWGKNKSPIEKENGKIARNFSFKELFSTSGVKQVCTAFFCYCSLEMTAGLWGSSFLVIEKGIPPETAASWIALYFFGITFGRFISGFLTMKFNNRQMIRIGQGLIACGIIMFFLPLGKMLLLPGFFIIGLGCAPIYPSLIHDTPKNFGAEKSQSIIGLQMASAYIGITFIPPFFGQIAKLNFIGFKFFPFFLAILLIIKIIMTETLARKVSRK